MSRGSPAVVRYLAIVTFACSAGFSVAQTNDAAAAQSAAESARRLRWSLTKEEIGAAIERYEARFGIAADAFMEEVVVITPPVPLRMRDPTQDIWGGVAAPFWALFNPAQSWRIFLPVPPKRTAPGGTDQDQ